MISDVEMYGELISVVRRQVVLGKSLVGLIRALETQDKQLRTLQGVVSSLQQDVATLEEKFNLMEKVLNVEVLPHIHEPCQDDIPNGEAERAEYQRWLKYERETL